MAKHYHVSRNEFGSGYTVTEDNLEVALSNYNGPDISIPLFMVVIFIITLPLSPILYWVSRHLLKQEMRLEEERSAAELRRLEKMLENGEDFVKPTDIDEIRKLGEQKKKEREQKKYLKFLKLANRIHLVFFILWALFIIVGNIIFFVLLASHGGDIWALLESFGINK